jgi:hypothetical protein
VERVRKVYEDAITNVGLNVAEAAPLWNDYRAFEQNLLDALAGSADTAAV